MPAPTLTRRHLFATSIAAPLAGWAGTAAAQDAFDPTPEIRPAADAQAGVALSGPNFSVGPRVTTFDYLNRFSVTSDFGNFEPGSNPMLRRTLREIPAIAALRTMSQTRAFTDAVAATGVQSFNGARNLIENPVGTLSGIPDGVGALFNRAGQSLRRRSGANESGTTQEVLAVASFKRDLARRVSVDVYSSNDVLQRELNRLSWASAVGNLSLSALSIATGAIVVQVASNVRLVEQARNLVEATPPSELSRRNQAELQRLGIPAATISAYLRSRVLSPRHETLIVASLASLGRIPGQDGFITAAAQVENELMALFYQQMAELLAGYHANVAPIRRLQNAPGVPVAETNRGTRVLLLPVDRLLWTAGSQAVARRVANTGQPAPEVWITGDASANARAGLTRAGLRLTERCGTRLPLLD